MHTRDRRPSGEAKAVVTVTFNGTKVELRAQSFNLSESQDGIVSALLVALTMALQAAGGDLSGGSNDAIEDVFRRQYMDEPVASATAEMERGAGSLKHFHGSAFVLLRCANPFCTAAGGCIAELSGPYTPATAAEFRTALPVNLHPRASVVVVGSKAVH